jgi:tRNA threonylcarbamoyladenosine biosynthesis protein TsaE
MTGGAAAGRGPRDAEIRAVMTEAELVAWGERIGRESALPLVLALSGDLGAGKTTLARAVARGAGVGGGVPSPTFNLRFSYRGHRGGVHHLDLYRLEAPDDVWELGWEDLGAGTDLVLIEWPERAAGLLPEPRWEIRLEEADHSASREVHARPVGRPGALPPPVPEAPRA